MEIRSESTGPSSYQTDHVSEFSVFVALVILIIAMSLCKSEVHDAYQHLARTEPDFTLRNHCG